MLRTASIALAAIAFAAPALAATTFTAQLETPVAEKERFVANKSLWTCEGEACSAELKRSKVTVRVCKRFVKEAGPVAAFGNEDDALGEDDLAACNEVAKR